MPRPEWISEEWLHKLSLEQFKPIWVQQVECRPFPKFKECIHSHWSMKYTKKHTKPVCHPFYKMGVKKKILKRVQYIPVRSYWTHAIIVWQINTSHAQGKFSYRPNAFYCSTETLLDAMAACACYWCMENLLDAWLSEFTRYTHVSLTRRRAELRDSAVYSYTHVYMPCTAQTVRQYKTSMFLSQSAIRLQGFLDPFYACIYATLTFFISLLMI